MLQTITCVVDTEYRVGDMVEVEGVGRGGIVALTSTMEGYNEDEPIALVGLQEGFWGWRGSSQTTEGDEGFTFVSTLVVSVSNLSPVTD